MSDPVHRCVCVSVCLCLRLWVCQSLMAGDSVLWESLRAISWLPTHLMRTVAVQPPAYRYASSPLCLYIRLSTSLPFLVQFTTIFSALSSQRACSLECLTAMGAGRVPRRSVSGCCTTLQLQWCQSRAWRSLRTAWSTADLFLPSCSGTNTTQTLTIVSLLHSTLTTSESSGKNYWTVRNMVKAWGKKAFMSIYIDIYINILYIPTCKPFTCFYHLPFLLVLQMLWITLSNGSTLTSPWRLKSLFPMTWWKAQPSR